MAETRTSGARTPRQSAVVREAIRTELAKDAAQAEPEEERRTESTVVALEHVSLKFDEPVLEDVSFAAHQGDTVAIVGESGTGKSTILKLILRLLVPDHGCVYIEGDDITKLSFDEALKVRQTMGMVF